MSTISNLAKSNIKSTKSRSILIVITIVLTTCLLTSVGIICANWGIVNIETAKDMYGSHHVRFSKATPEQIKQLATHLDIDAMEIVKTLGTYKDKESNTMFSLQYVENINDNYITEVKIKEGQKPTKVNEILLTEGYMTSLGKTEPQIGDTVSIKYESRKDNIEKTKDFVVSGIVAMTEGQIAAKNFYALVSEEYLKSEEVDSDTTFTTYVTFKGGSSLHEYEIQEMVDQIASSFNIPADNAKVNLEFIRSSKPDTTVISGGFVVALLIILSSMLVIYSIFYIAVINKVQEYGKIRAIGGTKKQIKNLIKKEGITLAYIAIPVGLVLGYLVGRFTVETAIITTDVKTGQFDLIIITFAALASLATVYMSLLKPMKIAGKISPVEAMRYNGEDNNKAKNRDGYFEMSVPKLVKANLIRNKKRTAMTLVSLCLSGILFIVASTILNSINIDKMTEHRFDGASMNVYLSNFNLESIENPDKNIFVVQENNPVTNNIEALKAIDGVEEIKLDKTSFLKSEELESAFDVIYVDNNFVFEAEKIISGEVNFDKIIKENGIIIDHPATAEYYGLRVGDTIKFTVNNSGIKEDMDFKVMAITDNVVGGSFVLPEEAYNNVFTGDTNFRANIFIDKAKYDEVKKSVASIIKQETFLDADYYDEEYKRNEMAVGSMKMMAYALVGVIGIIGFINLINTMITSVVVRKKELGMLQAIGLSNKQFRNMIQLEGLFFIVITILTTLTIGNVVGVIACILFKNSGASYATYSYPLIQTILLIVSTVGAQIIISYGITRSFNKDSLVDRVRYSE